MEKHSEKRPIDDLFARKLGDASLTPSSDGFQRLQARLGQKQPETRIVFWRNPIVHRYVAAAACLALVCFVGWQYWPSDQSDVQVAVRKHDVTNSKLNDSVRPHTLPVTKQTQEPPRFSTPAIDVVSQHQIARTGKKGTSGSRTKNASIDQRIEKPVIRAVDEEPVVAQNKPADNSIQNVAPPKQVADNTAKSTIPAERVLVVTISEPETLVAARQAAKTAIDEKATVAQADKSQDADRGGNIWQQVKRIKQGDVFARSVSRDDEHGLLGRAYSGLKRSFDKEKSAKQ